MPWSNITPRQLAEELGINYEENEQKHDLIKKIVKGRSELGITQAELAKRLGVSQSRIAKIESRVGVHKVSFDVLLRILATLGYSCKITPRKMAA